MKIQIQIKIRKKCFHFTWELPPRRASKRTLVSKGSRLLTTNPLTCRWISVAADSRRCKCTSKKK